MFPFILPTILQNYHFSGIYLICYVCIKFQNPIRSSERFFLLAISSEEELTNWLQLVDIDYNLLMFSHRFFSFVWFYLFPISFSPANGSIGSWLASIDRGGGKIRSLKLSGSLNRSCKVSPWSSFPYLLYTDGRRLLLTFQFWCNSWSSSKLPLLKALSTNWGY